jgi:tetratricopeptide (TPR) repeat protein
MKTIIKYLIISIFCVAGAGCSDLLDKTIYGVTNSNNFYKTEKEIQEALNECYYQTKSLYKTIVYLGDVTTDDAVKGGSSDSDDAECFKLQNFVVTADNEYAKTRWQSFYIIINRCNIVIEKAPDATGNPDILERYVKEAKFLRAWSYYMLATVYGGVPLVTTTLASEEYYIPRSTQDEVFTQIITDLQEAASLPKRSEYGAGDMGRITSGAAWALMGKAYLFQNKYSEAEDALKQVVQSGEYELHKEFYSNFDYADRNGVESIFEIQYKSGGGSNTGFALTQWISRVNEGGWGFHLPTQDLLSAFEIDDPRITYTFIRTGDRFAGDTYTQDNSAATPYEFHDRKVFVPKSERGLYVGDISHNVVILRYADVLLMYAEVLNENGKSTEALICLNKVRERARNTDPVDPKRDIQVYIPETDPATTLPDITVTDKQLLREIIWKERRCELAMEGQRRDDLVRQKRFGNVMREYAAKYGVDKGKLFNDEKDYLLPIHIDQILMSQGTLEQNPNY